MQIKDIMSRTVDMVDPNTTIRDAAVKMRDDNVGALPVGENDRLVGMVTDRDIAVRAVAENRAPGTTSVRDVMSQRVAFCYENNDVEEAAHVMADHKIRRLPVLNSDKRMVGIVAMADLARSDGPALEAAKEALKGVSESMNAPRVM